MPIIPPSSPSTPEEPPQVPSSPSVVFTPETTQTSTPTPAPQPVLTGIPPSNPLPRLLLLLVVVGIVVGLVFAAFRFFSSQKSSTSGSKGQPTTITYWGLWEPENVMQGIVSDYQSSHPNIKINYIRQSQKDYRERLQNALAGNTGPDIFRFHNTWVPMFKNYLSALPSSVMDATTFDKTFYPITQKDLKFNGKYIGLPLMIDTLLLYYNEDLLRASGKTPPTTWDELLTTAQTLTVKNGDKIITSGVALGNTTNVDHWPDILALLMLQNGTNMKKPGSTIGSDGKNLGADALTFYTLFTKTYRIWDETLPNSTSAFAAGKLALYFGPSWEAFEFAKNPSLHFSATATPKLIDQTTAYASYWADGVSEKSSHSKEAWDFLKFLIQKDNLQKFYEAQAKTRLFGEPPARIDMAAQFSSTPVVSAVLSSAPKAISWYMTSATWDGQSGLNSRLITYFADAVNAVNKGAKPDEALQTVDQGVAQIFQQYGIK